MAEIFLDHFYCCNGSIREISCSEMQHDLFINCRKDYNKPMAFR